MPAIVSGALNDPVRAKYAIEGRAFLLHRSGKVYVVVSNQTDRYAFGNQSDCRQLTTNEALGLEASLPLPIPSHLFADDIPISNRPIGLGDVIAWLTYGLGFARCASCQQRKQWLNRIVLWGW